MTAHVGFPTLRLIRYAVGAVTLDALAPGEWRMMSGAYADLVPVRAEPPLLIQRKNGNLR